MTLTDGFDRTDAELRAAADGVDVDDIDFVDYFGMETTETWYLPGQDPRLDNTDIRKQWFQFKTLNEGEIAELQSQSNNEVIVQRTSGDAKMKVDQAKDRHALIKKSVIAWNLLRKDPTHPEGRVSIPFPNGPREFEAAINAMPPKVIVDLEQAIRKHNPSLSGERAVEEIQQQMTLLEDEMKAARKREAGKDDS